MPVRHRLLALVRESPGISKSEARERLGVAWGTVVHHVGRLSREGLLVVEAKGRRVALFSPALGLHQRRCAAAVRDDQASQALAFLGQARQASLGEVAEALAVSRKVARRLVRGLLAAALVENTAAGRPRYVVARPLAAPPRPLVRLGDPLRSDVLAIAASA